MDSKSRLPAKRYRALCSIYESKMAEKKIKDKYYRKQVDFFLLLEKMKIWPARSGVLHGIKSIQFERGYADILTHCDKSFTVRNSKRSRAARWLRNKWYFEKCDICRTPEWKIEKYKKTFFSQHMGSLLRRKNDE